MVNTKIDPTFDHVGAYPIWGELITKGMFSMGLLLILFENKVTNIELLKLYLLIECSLKMFLINLMMLDGIDEWHAATDGIPPASIDTFVRQLITGILSAMKSSCKNPLACAFHGIDCTTSSCAYSYSVRAW